MVYLIFITTYIIGGYIKPVALANVRTLYQKLIEYKRTDIDIVGVGGVSSGKDAFELILCGAKAVQVGTCHWTEGPICFNRIADELCDIMKTKGYSSIKDFHGKLKPYNKSSATNKVKTPTSTGKHMDNNNEMKTLQSMIFMYQIGLVVLVAILVGVFVSKDKLLDHFCKK